jgi:hypothetical protein
VSRKIFSEIFEFDWTVQQAFSPPHAGIYEEKLFLKPLSFGDFYGRIRDQRRPELRALKEKISITSKYFALVLHVPRLSTPSGIRCGD